MNLTPVSRVVVGARAEEPYAVYSISAPAAGVTAGLPGGIYSWSGVYYWPLVPLSPIGSSTSPRGFSGFDLLT